MSKKRGHNPIGKFIVWAYCVRCGHVYINNEESRREARRPCPADDDN